jgi:hypothetical protein
MIAAARVNRCTHMYIYNCRTYNSHTSLCKSPRHMYYLFRTTYSDANNYSHVRFAGSESGIEKRNKFQTGTLYLQGVVGRILVGSSGLALEQASCPTNLYGFRVYSRRIYGRTDPCMIARQCLKYCCIYQGQDQIFYHLINLLHNSCPSRRTKFRIISLSCLAKPDLADFPLCVRLAPTGCDLTNFSWQFEADNGCRPVQPKPAEPRLWYFSLDQMIEECGRGFFSQDEHAGMLSFPQNLTDITQRHSGRSHTHRRESAKASLGP